MKGESVLGTSPMLPICLAGALLLLPAHWVAGALAAAAVHELFHMAALTLTGHRIVSFELDHRGARIRTDALSPGHELLCALAGPGGGLALFAFRRRFPVLGLCGLIHSLWNLLPLYPSDGARALVCFAGFFLGPERVRSLCLWAGILTGALLLLAGAWGSFFLKLGPLPMAVAIIGLIPGIKLKKTLQTGLTEGTIEKSQRE